MGMEANGESIGETILEVVRLFEARADSLCFPDLDHAVLTAHCERVHTCDAAVARAEKAFREAREALDEQRAQLKAAALRGLAYAKIYAESDVSLADELEGLSLASVPKAAPRGRGRKAKKETKPDEVKPQEALFEPASS